MGYRDLGYNYILGLDRILDDFDGINSRNSDEIIEDSTLEFAKMDFADVGLTLNDEGTVEITGGTMTTSINNQTGTTYTLLVSDASKLVTLTNASPITVTVPAESTVEFAIGTQIDLTQLGAGKVTFVGAGGVTINSKDANLSIGAQYVAVSLFKLSSDNWLLVGDLIA